MTIKTFYVLNTAATAPGYFGNLQDGGAAPAALNTPFGYNTGTSAVAFWRSRLGTTSTNNVSAATSFIDSAGGPITGTGATNTTAGDSFRTPTTLTGTLAAGNWTLTWGLRSGRTGWGGRIRCRIWAGVNADGTGARELTSGALAGSIATFTSTTATFTSTATWAAPAVTLSNEYLFFQVEWNVTTAGPHFTTAALFYQSSVSVTTTDLSAGDITGTLGATDAADTSNVNGLVGRLGALVVSDVADTANLAASVQWFGALAATDAADVGNLSGLVGRLGTLAATDAADTANLPASVQWLATLAAIEAQDVSAIAGPIPIFGFVAALEAADVAAIAASAHHTATLAVSEAADSASITGGAVSTATLAAIEAADHAAFVAGSFVTPPEVKTYFITARRTPPLVVTGVKQPCAITARRAPLVPSITGAMPPPAITARRNAAATWTAQQ